MKKVGIAILGLGVVGSGTYKILTEHRDFYKQVHGIDFKVENVLERNRARALSLGVAAENIASNMAEICSNSEVDIVVEVMGGVEPAKSFVLAELNAGKSVVTSNKELFCKYSHELEKAAKKNNCGLFFEASCVGGVPVIRTLLDNLQGNKITSMIGIINGTTNYILTKMSDCGASYEKILEEAQSLGYAEADPTADVEGFDAAYKLSILASLAFHTCVPYASIYREGITKVTAQDIKNAHALGYEIKLIAIGTRDGDSVEARVHPLFVPSDHPLAAVSGAYNAVYLNGDNVGDLMFYGAGAGARPTGSAIVSDVIKALTGKPKYTDFDNNGRLSDGIDFIGDFMSGYYICVTVDDKTGVLSKISTVLSDNGVSIKSAIQRAGEGDTATLLFLTHKAREHSVMHALDTISKLATVRSIDSMIRVM